MDQLCEHAGLRIVLILCMGPEGDYTRTPNGEAELCLLEEVRCLQCDFQSRKKAITGFFFSFQIIISMS